MYPLIVEQKLYQDYFLDNKLYYKNMYKSQKYLDLKEIFKKYCFAQNIEYMCLDSIDNVISAELEFEENKDNPLYDFSSIIVKYSKTMERELYRLFCALFEYLSYKDESILDISYSVQGANYNLSDIFYNKPNLGTYRYLMRDRSISIAFDSNIAKDLQQSIRYEILPFIAKLQDLRNENVHGKSASLNEAQDLRHRILGIGPCASILSLCVKLSKEIAIIKDHLIDILRAKFELFNALSMCSLKHKDLYHEKIYKIRGTFIGPSCCELFAIMF